jgi:hypothetical protein
MTTTSLASGRRGHVQHEGDLQDHLTVVLGVESWHSASRTDLDGTPVDVVIALVEQATDRTHGCYRVLSVIAGSECFKGLGR